MSPDMTLPLSLARELAGMFGADVAHARRLGGGCIHECRMIRLANGRRFFLKFQPADRPDWLAAEADGLAQLAPRVRVPRVLGMGQCPSFRWLALEWLDLRPHDPASMTALGGALGRLHAHHAPVHGHQRDGYLGTTPVENSRTADWTEFFLTRRVTPLLGILAGRGHDFPRAAIEDAITRRLAGHVPPASFLHGDLWTGNTAALPDGSPVIFDPSFHAGDAETDLAMLELFGGPLPEGFLAAYAEATPILPDRRDRRPAYDLLHALNHFLIFGDAYRPMVANSLAKLGVPSDFPRPAPADPGNHRPTEAGR